MNLLCATRINCDCTNNPVRGYSAEIDEVQEWIGVGYANPRMPIGMGWCKFGARTVSVSSVSESAAISIAYSQAILSAEDQSICGIFASDIIQPPIPPSAPSVLIIGEGGEGIIGEGGEVIVGEGNP